MGVTIHFKGNLKSDTDFDELIKVAKNFAESNKMNFNLFEEPHKILQRVRNEMDWDYEGLTRGVRIQPNENSDPLLLEFDKDNYIQEYCKTQFVEKEIHIKIIGLLRQIKPYFQELSVIDEGEYWDSNDPNLLQQHLDDCFYAIEEAKKEDESLSGPYRVEGNRIVDLISNE